MRATGWGCWNYEVLSIWMVNSVCVGVYGNVPKCSYVLNKIVCGKKLKSTYNRSGLLGSGEMRAIFILYI